MQGVEDVGAVLQRLSAPALFAPVEGDGDPGQCREALDGAKAVAKAVDEDQKQKLRRLSSRKIWNRSTSATPGMP